MKKIIVLVLLIVFTVSACSSNNDLTKVEVILDYVPNTNHSGIYNAIESGYYHEAGLDVSVVQPSQNTAESLVANNEFSFGISYGENVAQFNNSNDRKIKSIYTMYDHNTSGLISYKDKNITSVKDFKDKTYCGWGSDIETALLGVLLEKEGMTLDDMNIITTTVDFQNSTDECDLMWVFEGWDNVKLDMEGVEYNYIPFTDYDIDWYTPVIITNEQTDEQLIKDFIYATKRGYLEAIDLVDLSVDNFMKHNPEYDEEFIKNSQTYTSQHYSETGLQDEQIWNDFIDILKQNNIVDSNLESESLYTNDYITGVELNNN